MNKIKQYSIVFILVFLSFLFLPSVTSAQVILTDEEAKILGHELAIAKTSIENSKQELKTAKQRLLELSNDLEVQKQSLTEQQLLLNDANKSLNELNKEVRKKLNKYKWQRNCAYGVALCLGYMLVKK